MRRFVLLPVFLAAALAASSSQARLFWQTYGATVAAPDGAGCVWNANQDYFVPRHCDSGRYGLYSPCKESHYSSPACRRLHPIYGGYCTPYGGWHYVRRDHVYAKHCGCTPLACYHGPWKLDRCKKHCFALRDPGCCPTGHRSFCASGGNCSGGACMTVANMACDLPWQGVVAGCEPRGVESCYGWLPNVEPLGGESLGGIPAMATSSGAAGGAGGAGAASMGTFPMLPMPAPTTGATGLPTSILGF